VNILKMIGQRAIDSALPGIKFALRQQAASMAARPKYVAVAPLILLFLDDLLDNWTIKL